MSWSPSSPALTGRHTRTLTDDNLLRSSGSNPFTASGGWKVIPDAGAPSLMAKVSHDLGPHVSEIVQEVPENANSQGADVKLGDEEMHAADGRRVGQGDVGTAVVQKDEKTSAVRRTGSAAWYMPDSTLSFTPARPDAVTGFFLCVHVGVVLRINQEKKGVIEIKLTNICGCGRWSG